MSETMLSYHGDKAIKIKYQNRFAEHRAADEVIQGVGFINGRGCFVGCILDKYDHSRFPAELGWPEWLARLADTIFEGLPKDEAPQFGTDLLEAVPVGVDLQPLIHTLAIKRIDRLIALQSDNKDFDTTEVIAALNMVRRCHEAEAGGNSCDWSAAKSATWSAAESAESAESAAESAAWSAKSAARSAAKSAESAESARSAAESAESAAWSAESAESAWSAESAESAESARSAAESAAFQVERDTLIACLQELSA